MKILFLGTGAADYSAEHRNLAGYRRNASALIDETLLIDPGPCVPDALATFGVRADKIRYVIHTHRQSGNPRRLGGAGRAVYHLRGRRNQACGRI